MSSAFFTLGADGETFEPRPAATSGWNPQHIRGPALAGLLARAAQAQAGSRPELRPVRATFDLFRPSRMVPTRTHATTVRSGRRLALVDSFLVQDDEVVARAATLFLAAGADPGIPPWQSPEWFDPPPADQTLGDEARLYRSGDQPWTSKADEHDNRLRKQVWQEPMTVVHGEEPSAFQFAATVSDLASLVVHLAPGGLRYINADITLSMARLPAGGIGLAAASQVADAGISTGVAVLFDRQGTFGSATVSALANSTNALQPRGDRTE